MGSSGRHLAAKCHKDKCSRKVVPLSAHAHFSLRQNQERLVVIDSDPGTDDAWALFMALRAHRDPTIQFRIIAITTTHGNTSIDNVTTNMTRILQTVNETGIPVYRGSERALTVPLILTIPPYHGEDGFGDADLPPIEPVLAEGDAVNTLIRLAEEYNGQLSVLALAPLTNLALAIRVKPDISFREIFLMGGNIRGEGNTNPGGEFNFLVDAEAARTTLESYTCPILIAPWETCQTYGTTTKSYRMDDLGSLATPEMELLNLIEANILENTPTDTWMVPDPILMAIFINPDLGRETETYYCTVELNGTHTRGMMVVDRNGFLGVSPNATYITAFDSELYLQMLRWGAGGPAYK